MGCLNPPSASAGTRSILSKMTELQQKVIDTVIQRLKHEPWFRGVCLDALPSDQEIEKDFEEAVEQLILDTAYWDDPDVNYPSYLL